MNVEKIDHPLEFLKEQLEAQLAGKTVKLLKHADKTLDGLIEIDGELILVEFKQEINPQNVNSIEQQLLHYKTEEHLMAMANYITPKAKELLIEKKINYLDRAGNIYLKLPELLIRIEGNKNSSVISESYKSRAFTKAGAAVVFQFLMDTDLVNAPQRKMAERAGVSLGTVPKVIEGLKKEGFLIKQNNKQYQLINYERLLSKWSVALQDKVLPAHKIQQYQPVKKTVSSYFAERSLMGDTQWGGEAAAALLTDYLKPEEYCLFTENKSDLLKKHKLIPAKDGEIIAYKKFWKYSSFKGDYVHPVLIYAQLISSTDSRNLETAEIILNEHIRPNV